MRHPAAALVLLFVACARPSWSKEPTITTSALDDAAVGVPYEFQLHSDGGTAPITWSLENVPGELAWMQFDPATHTISGKPTRTIIPGVAFTVRVTDGYSLTSTTVLTLRVLMCNQPGQPFACTYTDGVQCLQSSVVCSAEGTYGSCGGETPSTNFANCGPGLDGTCGSCSPATADGCNGVCFCGAAPACSGTMGTCCAGACTDTMGDADNCGACSNRCEGTVANGRPACRAGRCGIQCNTGYVPCEAGCCTITAISAGGSHTCALTNIGGVKCWGSNTDGQLGDGTTTSSSVPIDVPGLTTGVTAVGAGWGHTCALMTGGGVKCWGFNMEGQLGNGSTKSSHVPVDVHNLAGVTAISVGTFHSCGHTAGGGVRCWGRNDFGQLGNSGTGNGPVDVTDLTTGVAAVYAGYEYSCALTIGGGVKCWGYNFSGQLGDNGSNSSSAPVDVYGLTSGVVAIDAGGGQTCAVTTGGGLKCWGFNGNGQVGNNSKMDSHAPTDVVGLESGVAGVATGGWHSCAFTDRGDVKCWGLNSAGTLGTSPEDVFDSSVPLAVPGLSGVTAISAGGGHSCALTSGGAVKCWGSNNSGQLGDGSTASSAVPEDVTF